MRPHKEFAIKWLWKRVDYDWAYKYQCTDVVKQYMEETLKLWKIGALWNAKNMPDNKFFQSREHLGMDNLMQWDIIVRTRGRYGHVAIVDHIANGKVYVLEQNGSGKNSGSGLGENAIRIKGYPLAWYDIVLRCQKIFENLQAERKFVAEKIARLQAEIKLTEGYIKTTRWQG